MIDTFKPVRDSYYAALNGNISVTIPPNVSGSVVSVYSHVPDDVGQDSDYLFILLGNQSDEGGADIATASKDNKYATSHLIEVDVVHGLVTAEDNASYQVADLISDAVMQIVFAGLTFAGLENVVTQYDSGTYEVERNNTHLVIKRKIIFNHLISQ